MRVSDFKNNAITTTFTQMWCLQVPMYIRFVTQQHRYRLPWHYLLVFLIFEKSCTLKNWPLLVTWCICRKGEKHPVYHSGLQLLDFAPVQVKSQRGGKMHFGKSESANVSVGKLISLFTTFSLQGDVTINLCHLRVRYVSFDLSKCISNKNKYCWNVGQNMIHV